MCTAWGIPLPAFRTWGQNFPGEKTVHSKIDTAALAWQEWPVSKSQSSEAGRCATGHCLHSPRTQDFPESDTTQG